MNERRSDPAAEVRRLYEDAESRTAKAFEEAVSRGSFGELLARMTENVVALTKIGTDAFDLVLRNLRLAGRQDLARLARQMNRTEDKLELVLQHLESVEGELEGDRAAPGSGRRATANGSEGDGSGSRRRGRVGEPK